MAECAAARTPRRRLPQTRRCGRRRRRRPSARRRRARRSRRKTATRSTTRVRRRPARAPRTEEQRPHLVAGKEHEVTAQHTRDGARSAQVGDQAVWVEGDLGERRGEAAAQVEQQKRERPEAVLEVVAKDPQVEQVAAQVEQPPVHEHRRQDRQVDRNGTGRVLERHTGRQLHLPHHVHAGRDLVGNDAVAVRKRLVAAEPLKEHEHEHVGGQQGERHERRARQAAVVVGERKEHGGR